MPRRSLIFNKPWTSELISRAAAWQNRGSNGLSAINNRWAFSLNGERRDGFYFRWSQERKLGWGLIKSRLKEHAMGLETPWLAITEPGATTKYTVGNTACIWNGFRAHHRYSTNQKTQYTRYEGHFLWPAIQMNSSDLLTHKQRLLGNWLTVQINLSLEYLISLCTNLQLAKAQ